MVPQHGARARFTMSRAGGHLRWAAAEQLVGPAGCTAWELERRGRRAPGANRDRHRDVISVRGLAGLDGWWVGELVSDSGDRCDELRGRIDDGPADQGVRAVSGEDFADALFDNHFLAVRAR